MSRFCGYTREQEPKKHARKKKTDEEKEVKRRTESKDASMGQEIEPETRTDSSDSESDIEEVDQHGAFLCTKCRVMGRDGLNFQRPPNVLDPFFYAGIMCQECYNEGTEEMRQVCRHDAEDHSMCPPEFPASQLVWRDQTPIQDLKQLLRIKTEWRHSHNDHSTCSPEYLLGCTTLEHEQKQIVEAHIKGDHTKCPIDFPQTQLVDGYQHPLSNKKRAIVEIEWKRFHADLSKIKPIVTKLTSTPILTVSTASQSS